MSRCCSCYCCCCCCCDCIQVCILNSESHYDLVPFFCCAPFLSIVLMSKQRKDVSPRWMCGLCPIIPPYFQDIATKYLFCTYVPFVVVILLVVSFDICYCWWQQRAANQYIEGVGVHVVRCKDLDLQRIMGRQKLSYGTLCCMLFLLSSAL